MHTHLGIRHGVQTSLGLKQGYFLSLRGGLHTYLPRLVLENSKFGLSLVLGTLLEMHNTEVTTGTWSFWSFKT
jgi:hypothetical protein